MSFKKIDWCCKQKNGIKLIEPNINLSNKYMTEADQTLEVMLANKGRWKVIIGYYACYNALYSILMKTGIKSEIHDCSIEIMRLIGAFDKEDYSFLKSLKDDRIDVQYYLKEKEIEDENRIKDFILKCKQILSSPDFDNMVKRIKEAIRIEKN